MLIDDPLDRFGVIQLLFFQLETSTSTPDPKVKFIPLAEELSRRRKIAPAASSLIDEI
jgi:hypothetical protein